MTSVEPFTVGKLDVLARFLGECSRGTEISRVLTVCRLPDDSGESTK